MQDTLDATNLDEVTTSQLVITALPDGTTHLTIRNGAVWNDLLDLPDAKPAAPTTAALIARAQAGTLAIVAPGDIPTELDALPERAVVRTESGWYFQKSHASWWRMTATWTGDACAIPPADLIRGGARLCWTPTGP